MESRRKLRFWDVPFDAMCDIVLVWAITHLFVTCMMYLLQKGTQHDTVEIIAVMEGSVERLIGIGILRICVTVFLLLRRVYEIIKRKSRELILTDIQREITASREAHTLVYTQLADQDTHRIPKVIEHKGRELILTDIQWEIHGEQGGSERYSATATYERLGK